MRPQQELTLKAFEDFAGQNFPIQFATFSRISNYVFERKELENQWPQLHQKTTMLLVGCYHTQRGLPNVWVYTNGCGIFYCLGLKGASQVKHVPDEHGARIFFNLHPFNQMIGGNDTEVSYTRRHARYGHTPGVTHWKGIIESVIYFIHLKKSHLEYAYCEDVRAVLNNFRKACLYFAMRNSPASGPGVWAIKGEPSDTDFLSSTSSIGGHPGGWGAGQRIPSKVIDKYKKPHYTTKVKVEEEHAVIDLASFTGSPDHRNGSIVGHHHGSDISSDVSSLSNSSNASSSHRSAGTYDSALDMESTPDHKILKEQYRREKEQARATRKLIRERRMQRAKSIAERRATASTIRKAGLSVQNLRHVGHDTPITKVKTWRSTYPSAY